MTDLERDFVRFREHGDGRALARVFDALAPELLLVALHLCRDESAAQDVVQDAFLRAMDIAASYDPARPLRPWLAGIVTRVAWHARRAESRRVDPARLGTPENPDPSAAAEAAELAETVSATIARLPASYRDALTLRLVHGLSAREIAQALGRSPSTVHTQLQRGVERLRAIAPRVLAPTTIAALATTPGLAAARRAVLARAASQAGATTAATIGGLIWMWKKTTVAVLAIGAALWWTFHELPTAAEVAGADPNPVLEHATANRTAPSEPTGSGDSASRSRRTPAPVTREPAGRCIAAESGEPLAGVVVKLPPAYETVTGPDGSFELPDQEFGNVELLASGRVPRRVPLAPSLGDVELERGTVVAGRVVDEAGGPVERVRLSLELVTRADGGAVHQGTGSASVTGTGGRFRTDVPLTPGRWSCRWDTSAYRVVRPEHLDITLADSRQEVEIVVRALGEADRIQGTVVDPAGQPVAGVRIVADTDNATGFAEAVSRTDGTFVLTRGETGGAHARLQTIDTDAPYAVVSGLGRYAWGTRDVRVVVRPAVAVDLFVVDDAGAPVEDFGVILQRAPADTGGRHFRFTSVSVAHRGSHDAGHLHLDGVYPGSNRLIVAPTDAELVANPPLEFDAGAAQGVVRVTLQRRGRLPVRVADAAGHPIAGAKLELAQGGPKDWSADTEIVDVDELFTLRGEDPIRIDSTVTGASGDAELTAPRTATGLTITATAPGYLPARRHDVTMPHGAEPERIVLHRGGTITGSVGPTRVLDGLVPAANPEARATVSLRRDGTPLAGHDELEIGADGSFRAVAVPAGDVDVFLSWWVTAGSNSYRVHSARIGSVLGLRNDETRAVELDVSAHERARFGGRILLNGEPYVGQFCLLACDADGIPNREGNRLQLGTGARGGFELGLDPGRYRVQLAPHPWSPVPNAPISERVFEVAPAANLDELIAIRRRVLRIVVRDAGGEPVANRAMLVTGVARYVLRTDADGVLVVAPAAPWPYRLRALPRDADAFELSAERDDALPDLGEWIAVPGRDDRGLELRLPPGFD